VWPRRKTGQSCTRSPSPHPCKILTVLTLWRTAPGRTSPTGRESCRSVMEHQPVGDRPGRHEWRAWSSWVVVAMDLCCLHVMMMMTMMNSLAQGRPLHRNMIHAACVLEKNRWKLDGQGRARRQAARRPKSECKVKLDILNSSRSSASKRLQKMYPRTTWRMDLRQLTAYEHFGCAQ